MFCRELKKYELAYLKDSQNCNDDLLDLTSIQTSILKLQDDIHQANEQQVGFIGYTSTPFNSLHTFHVFLTHELFFVGKNLASLNSMYSSTTWKWEVVVLFNIHPGTVVEMSIRVLSSGQFEFVCAKNLKNISVEEIIFEK